MHKYCIKICKVVRTNFFSDCFMQFIGIEAGLAGLDLTGPLIQKLDETYYDYAHNNTRCSCPTVHVCYSVHTYTVTNGNVGFSQSMYASMAEASSHNIVTTIIILQRKRAYCM